MPQQCKALDREHWFASSTIQMNVRAATGMFAVENITLLLDLLKAHRKTLILLYLFVMVIVVE